MTEAAVLAHPAAASGAYAALPEADYVAITPYLVPPGPKKVNVGDGFILDSAARLIGARPCALLSSRRPLGDAEIARINASRAVVVAGANTLKDDFEIAPGFDRTTLDRLAVPVVLMGIGHYGVPAVTRGLSAASAALFRALLERFPAVSVRCDASRRYLAAALPDKEDAILMTSCPVIHRLDATGGGFARKDTYDRLVVTVTDRAMLEAQLPLLPAAKTLFPARRRILALHQDYRNEALWRYAAGHGFEVVRGDAYEPFLDLYAATDMHFGNRVHAHLKCLSLGVPSFLTPFDLRQAYFAESLDFPLISEIPSREIAGYDFARFAARQAAARHTMDAFLARLRDLVGLA